MATQFQDIYELSNVTRADTRLRNKPINQVYKYFYNLLVFSISEFLADCYKDISSDNRVNFEEKEYTFQGNIGESTFTLNAPPTEFTDIYLNIDDESVEYSFSFDDITNILTISPSLTKNCEIYISVFRKGYFIADLNDTERVILAEGMNIPFLEEQRNKNELLNQMVYSGDGRIYSQSAHIDSLNDSIKMQYEKIVRPKINDYSYKFSPNKLIGMSGKPYYIPSGGVYR